MLWYDVCTKFHEGLFICLKVIVKQTKMHNETHIKKKKWLPSPMSSSRKKILKSYSQLVQTD